MSAEWQHGLFGCFDNLGICIITYFVPCYQFGKNAEAVGEDCLLCGIALLVPVLDLFALWKIRGKVREQKGIAGSSLGDLLTICCCACCTIIQEAQELNTGVIGQSMARQ